MIIGASFCVDFMLVVLLVLRCAGFAGFCFDLIVGDWWFGVTVDSRFYCLWLGWLFVLILIWVVGFLVLWFCDFRWFDSGL